MKRQKVLTIITIILLIVIITIASIFGVYKLQNYKVDNIVPNYLLGMEFTNSRILNLEVDKSSSTTIYDKDGNEIQDKEEGVEYTEENGYKVVENKTNPDSVLTDENFKITKSILKNRLKKLGVDQYKINLDKNNGNFQMRIPENNNVEETIYNVLKDGTFEMQDSETGEVLINRDNIKDTKVLYGQKDMQVVVYLQVKFDKEGANKLEEISKKYIETTVQKTNDEGEMEESKEIKKVKILLDGEIVTETYFGDTMVDGILNIPFGASDDSEMIQQYTKKAKEAEIILNSGMLPIKYTQSNYQQKVNIGEQQIKIVMYILIASFALMFIFSLIKFKLKGLLVVILEIGYVSLLLLTLRYTNVKITIEGICGIVIGAILNYIYIYMGFKNIKSSFLKDITAKYALKLIPIYVLAVIFSFNRIANIYSLGMTLLWSVITMYLYNLVLTRVALKVIKE